MASELMTRLQNSSSEGILALAIALGHEVGIFDIIMTSSEPLTSLEIAEKGNLKERYVREWLGCVVAGQVVQIETGNPFRYFIAEEYKGMLENIMAAARLFSTSAVRYDAVKACFRQDGPAGVSHSDFPDVFHAFDVLRNAENVDGMLKHVQGLASKLEEGIQAIDFGCGSGVMVVEMARRFPNSHFHGSDISEQAISLARQRLAASGLHNVTFSTDNLLQLPAHLHAKFDFAFTYDVIHDLSQPLQALNEISQCLKPSGLYVMADIHTPKDRGTIAKDDASMLLYGLSTFLCLPASAGQGPGTAWSVEEANDFISQSHLELLQITGDEPNFAYHVCKKREAP